MTTEGQKISAWQPRSKFSMGANAFERISQLMDMAMDSGHIARSKPRPKYIIKYFSYLETISIPLTPVLEQKDRDEIDSILINLKKNHIFLSRRSIRGNPDEIVNKLTDLERLIYHALQTIGMYIVLLQKKMRANKKTEMKEHLEGVGIPELTEDGYW